MNLTRNILLDARKIYGICAGRIEKNIKSSAYTDILSEKIIGIGTAADWIRRAAELESVVYLGDQLNNSWRKILFLEMLRFEFCWFGINAIFTRPSLLIHFGKSADTEIDQFLLLYNSGAIPDVTKVENELYSLLSENVTTRMPNHKTKVTVSTLAAIDSKYCPRIIKGANARMIRNAHQNNGNISSLTVPVLIYAFRNWFVHGNTLDGCFGSRPKFLKYTCLLQQVLASVHLNVANKLKSEIK